MKIVDLKNEMDARFLTVDERFDAIDRRFDAVDRRFDAVDRRFDAVDDRFRAVDERFEHVEHALATGFETLRRHMEILFEQSRADFRLGLERIDAQQHQIDVLLSSNTHEHSAFVEMLQDHEVRIKALEPPNRPSKTPRSR